MLFFKLWITDCSLLLYQQTFVILKKRIYFSSLFKDNLTASTLFNGFSWIWMRGKVCVREKCVFVRSKCRQVSSFKLFWDSAAAVSNTSHSLSLSCTECVISDSQRLIYFLNQHHRYSVINYVLTVDWVYCQHLSEKFLCPDQREQKTLQPE